MLDFLYSLGIKWRNRQFDTKKFISYKSLLPVISVGNITTGGTGKSPFVQTLARHCINEGKNVAIIGRGYRRSTKGFLHISDGTTIFENAKTAGDELLMHASALPNVTVIADEKRSRAAKWLEKNTNCNLILLDDGFQHRYLARDVDIVLIDERTLTTRLLPFGHLREPLTSLQRASVLCFTDTVSQHMKIKLLKDIPHLPTQIFTYSTNFRAIRPAWSIEETHIQPQHCEVLTSIAHPQRFHTMLQDAGWSIIHSHTFPDHYFFTERDIVKICNSNAQSVKKLLMTTKDEGKLSSFKYLFEQYSIECFVAEIETSIDNEAKFYSYINSIITKKT